MPVASVSTDWILRIFSKIRQMADPSRWLTRHNTILESQVGYPPHQPEKIQRSFDRNLQGCTRSHGPESTPIADPTAPSYVDSSTRGKIHLRWRSSPPHFARPNVLDHVESYVNTHPLGSALQITFLSFQSHKIIILLDYDTSCHFLLSVPTAQDTFTLQSNFLADEKPILSHFLSQCPGTPQKKITIRLSSSPTYVLINIWKYWVTSGGH